SGKAGDLLNALTAELGRLSVKVVAGETVVSFVLRDGAAAGVKTSSGIYKADAVIFATGGRSYPALSGGADAYPAAAAAGHTIVTPLPGMTNLVTREEWCGKCAGIALPDAESWIDLPGERKRRCRGDLLFTRDGVSAFAVLDHAGRISELLQKTDFVPLQINLFAGRDEAFWREEVARWRRESGKKLAAGLLAEHLPRRLAEFLLGGDGGIAARMSASQQNLLIRNLTALPLTICGTGDWNRAMVTRGGVALREVSPRTLESRLIRGLYFAGEVLNLDGPCGGYNLTWAFSSGRLAGESAAAALLASNQ
ncbi:MAG: aminoacetone oxidase family FAD-binding enzyme, partial [Lentisphaeria bacterium]|nr:aminoacetone oxidase family FAD-binding enzyme [Lentisphaeria bacterium]